MSHCCSLDHAPEEAASNTRLKLSGRLTILLHPFLEFDRVRRLREVRWLLIYFRIFSETDDVEAINTLLRAAYKPLAEAGMRYAASHEDVAAPWR